MAAGADGISDPDAPPPDGDTIGSAALLCRALRSLGKCADILQNPELTPRYASLHAGLTRPEAERRIRLCAWMSRRRICRRTASAALPGALPCASTTTRPPPRLRSWRWWTRARGRAARSRADVLEELGVRLDVPMALALLPRRSQPTPGASAMPTPPRAQPAHGGKVLRYRRGSLHSQPGNF